MPLKTRNHKSTTDYTTHTNRHTHKTPSHLSCLLFAESPKSCLSGLIFLSGGKSKRHVCQLVSSLVNQNPSLHQFIRNVTIASQTIAPRTIGCLNGCAIHSSMVNHPAAILKLQWSVLPTSLPPVLRKLFFIPLLSSELLDCKKIRPLDLVILIRSLPEG